MSSALEISQAILRLSNPDVGDIMTNLKLQKLLYYVQGYHVALHGKGLFRDPIFAWQYGPVVKDVYHEYKKFGSAGIEPPESNEPLDRLSEPQRQLLLDVFDLYGQFSALKLMNMTHNEAPWRETPISEEITVDKLYKYFSPLVGR